jgi:hypothetical protein
MAALAALPRRSTLRCGALDLIRKSASTPLDANPGARSPRPSRCSQEAHLRRDHWSTRAARRGKHVVIAARLMAMLTTLPLRQWPTHCQRICRDHLSGRAPCRGVIIPAAATTAASRPARVQVRSSLPRLAPPRGQSAINAYEAGPEAHRLSSNPNHRNKQCHPPRARPIPRTAFRTRL